MSDSWNVTLECLPGAGRVLARGEAVVFTSTLFDGKVNLTKFWMNTHAEYMPSMGPSVI